MNKIFKKVTLFVAMIMAVCAISVATSTEAKAYTTITVRQTAQTTSTVTIAWNAVPGANQYVVSDGYDPIAVVTSTSYTLQLVTAQAGYQDYIYVYAYSGSSKVGSGYTKVTTAPVISNVSLYQWAAGTTTPIFSFTGNNKVTPTGVEVELKNAKKKLIKVVDVNFSSYATVNAGGSIKNASFIMRARPYYTINGVKIYGAWTAPKAYVAQPKVTGKSRKEYYSKSRTISIKWPKIKGAKSYTVYRSTKRDGKYKKVGTTTKNTFSQSVNYYSTYYYYVKANKVNVGGKKMSTTLGEVHNIAVSY